MALDSTEDQTERRPGRDREPSEKVTEQELRARRAIDLLATYEDLCGASGDERLTYYFSDYGLHFLIPGVSEEQLRAAYHKALAAMEMDGRGFRCAEGFCYRGEMVCRMRDCLLAKELAPGQRVLFAGTEPEGNTKEFTLQLGTLRSIDRERKTCVVSGAAAVMENVPLHYVLGRFDRGAVGRHYGFEHIRPLLTEDAGLATHCLFEAREKWSAEEAPAQSMTL